MYEQSMEPQVQPGHPYKKLGGWLVFLVVMAILGAVIKLFTLPDFIKAFQQLAGGSWAPLVDSLLNLAGLAMGVAFIVTVFRRGPRFLFFWQLGWAAALVKQLLFAGGLIVEFAGKSADEILEALEQAQPDRIAQLEEIMAQSGLTMEKIMPIIVGVAAAIGFLAVLGCVLRFLFVTLYYRRSVRVRTYMGSGEYLRLAFFTRKANPQPAVPDEGAAESEVESEETSE